MTPPLQLRPADDCRFDVVTLGEVMLRFDPGEGRVRTARTFRVTEGGGEYNVGRALRRVFGHRAALVTAIGDNEIGRLLEDLLLQGGMNLDHVVWKVADEIGLEHRTPLNFTERGFGVRPPRGVSDRAHSATGSMEPGDVDWQHLFGELGVRWFHTGGIFAGLSDSTLETTRTAIAAAAEHGTVVSYDVNYRPSLWRAVGGSDAHRRLTDELLPGIDVLFGVDSVDGFVGRSGAPSIVASTRRRVHSASSHDWGGTAWSKATGELVGITHERLDILDRIGGGDGFSAGVIHGLLEERSLRDALSLGIAHGALIMTTPGDTSPFDIADVERLATGTAPTVER